MINDPSPLKSESIDQPSPDRSLFVAGPRRPPIRRTQCPQISLDPLFPADTFNHCARGLVSSKRSISGPTFPEDRRPTISHRLPLCRRDHSPRSGPVVCVSEYRIWIRSSPAESRTPPRASCEAERRYSSCTSRPTSEFRRRLDARTRSAKRWPRSR